MYKKLQKYFIFLYFKKLVSVVSDLCKLYELHIYLRLLKMT